MRFNFGQFSSLALCLFSIGHFPASGQTQDPHAAAATHDVLAAGSPGPDLAVNLTHTSAFLQGQTNAVYLIRVTNEGGTATTGTISVVDLMPSGINITSMSGPGWSCLSNTCNRSDSVPPGQMLPTITVLASVAANAPPSVSNMVTVSGGSDPIITNNIANDVTTIAAEGRLLSFGYYYSPSSGTPKDLSDVVAISAGSARALALRKNGTVVEWANGGLLSSAVAQALTNVVAVSAGYDNSFALLSDGTVVAWTYGSTAPPATGWSNIVALETSDNFCLALRADGTVSGVGTDNNGTLTIPSNLSNVIQVSASSGMVLALQSNGVVVPWGSYAPHTPAGLEPLTRIAALNSSTAAGIKPDGTVVVWSNNATPLTTIPSGVNNIVDITGEQLVMAVRNDGTVKAWGNTGYGLSEFAANLAHTRTISASFYYALAILDKAPVLLKIQAAAKGLDLTSNYYYSGPVVTLDGTALSLPYSALVAPDSTHTIATALTQTPGGGGIQFLFANWSDGGSASHTVTIPADTSYTANYTVKFQLSTSAGTGGTISPAPASTFYDPGTSILIRATPSAGYVFSGFYSNSTGTEQNNPSRVEMSAPVSISANFLLLKDASLRMSLKPMRQLVQGQQNAVYIGRLFNDSPNTVTGIQVQFSGMPVVRMSGTGWACTSASCSRTDALAPGSAYPAILIIAAADSTATGTVTPSLALNTYPYNSAARAPSKVYGAGNAAIGWGNNASGQATAPAGLTNLVDIAGGISHSVALRGDGTVVAWGDNSKLQTKVPSGLVNLVAIAAGGNHSLALNEFGSVVAWGDNTSGQSTVPANLLNVIAVAGGANHSLALTSSGAVVAWGANSSGQSTVPATVKDAVAIAAGGDHSLAVLRDGSVVAWGSNAAGESNVPTGLARVESVAAGPQYSMALLDDGTVIPWGTVPPSIVSGMPAGLTNVRVLSAGGAHAVALQWDQTLLSWGVNTNGQTSVPPGLTQITAVGAGSTHSLAIAATPAVVNVSFATNPSGATFTVDGAPYTTNQSLQWTYGSTHTVSVPSPQPGVTPGSQFVLSSWSDGSALTTRTFTATQNASYTLTFRTQYALTTSASAGGSISPSTAYFDADSTVTVRATANQGYVFAGFGGDISGLSNPRSFVLKGPVNVSASFVAPQGKAKFKVNLRHTSAFLRGQTNAVYLVRIGSDPTGGATSGQVQMTPTVPAGLQITSMSGPGWTCTASTCTRSDVLTSGQSYPAITALAKIDDFAPGSLTFQAGVSGGGTSGVTTASDTAAVNSIAYPIYWAYYYYSYNNNEKPFPEGLNDAVAVALGGGFRVALKKDGTVVAWGTNQDGQCNVPAGLTNVVAISAGSSYTLALKADGTVVAWGNSQVVTGLPAGLTNLVGIAAGTDNAIGIRADGTLTWWGNQYYYLDLTALAQVRNAVAVSMRYNAVALTADGIPVSLTSDASTLPPPSLSNVVSVFSGYSGYSFGAITQAGTLTIWPPTSNSPPPTDWVNLSAVALGGSCPLALKQDGTISQWNCTMSWVTTQPKDVPNVTALVGTGDQALALTSTPPQVQVSVGASSTSFTVDGTLYQQPQTFTWPYGSIHTVSATSPIDGGAGSRSVFSNWSDGGAIAHSFVAASAGQTQLTAYLKTQYYMTTKATQGGTISPPSGWYDANYTLVFASPDQGYTFKDFTGATVENGTRGYLYLNAPTTVTANFVSQTAGPKLAITSTHTGSFTQGQQGAAYTLTVGNASGSPATTGTVYVTNTLPAGLTPISITGNGWNCQNLSTCYRSDTLAGGSSYPPLIVTVNVAINATSPQVNQATVTGGNSPQASTTDSTAILTLVNLTSNPSGMTIVADGTAYTTPKSFGWAAGSSHTLSVGSPQTFGNSRYGYLSWSDGGAQAHTITAPSTSTTYSANFKTQNKLTLVANPGGSISASPASADGWYDTTQVLQITAAPAALYTFSNFSGDLVGGANPQSIAMVVPRSVTANFLAINPQPSAASVTPSSGSGTSASFTATYTAGLGYQDLQWVQLLIATAANGGGQPYCFVHFDVQGDSFWVYGDGGFFVGPVKRGTTSAQLQNSLCALNTKTSTVTGNGTALTLKADIVFKAAAAKNIYLRAYTQGNLDTNWVQKGTWTTASSALGSMSVLPASGTAAQQTFAASFADPAGYDGTAAGWSQFLVAAATDGGGQPFCFVHYDRAGNGLWMYSGDVGFFLGPVSPGTAANTLTSSACSVDTSASTVTNQAGTVKVNVPITLKAPMSGAKKLFQRSLDPLGRDSGWLQTGTFTIP
ncbi:InlB B-repeat-containing protein [Paludibaculum fermentans]|uniref:InlB B-repeat-containing protein n=1 Tax=Paludibaculum fermentans TaxID=1473598 RepID=UPI003EB9F889